MGNISEKKAPKARRALFRYLGKYLCRPQISLKRILSYSVKKDEVVYRYSSHETGKSEVERTDILTFIGRMVQQILPKSFKRIRYYGLQAINNKSRLTAKVCSALGKLNFIEEVITRSTASVRGSYKEMVELLWGQDPFKCGNCGSTMELVRVWDAKKGFVFSLYEKLFGKDIGPPGNLPEFVYEPSG